METQGGLWLMVGGIIGGALMKLFGRDSREIIETREKRIADLKEDLKKKDEQITELAKENGALKAKTDITQVMAALNALGDQVSQIADQMKQAAESGERQAAILADLHGEVYGDKKK